jgi:hypothetical protein
MLRKTTSRMLFESRVAGRSQDFQAILIALTRKPE